MSTKGREAAKIAAIIGGGAVVGRRWDYSWLRRPGRKRGGMLRDMPSGRKSRPPVSVVP
jgi:hypothetical protein